jgi:hypothetical protein
MRSRGPIAMLAVVGVACSFLLVGGPAARGKENVTARLLSPLPLDAAPGEKLTVVWALGGVDEQGRHRPFNAIGVFVRLLSASGDGSTVGFATHDAHPTDATTRRWSCPRAASAASGSGCVAPAMSDPATRSSRWRTTHSPHQPDGWPSGRR